jgi:hypothetical protein
MINADKPHLWKQDILRSVDQFNTWFIDFAPLTFRETRTKTMETVRDALVSLHDMADISPHALQTIAGLLPTLRMSTAPPLARDRLIGLSNSSKSLVETLEDGTFHTIQERANRAERKDLQQHLESICAIIKKLLDVDIFPWLAENRPATEDERRRASTIVADRLCGSLANPIVRNAQERRQLALVEDFLTARGYSKHVHLAGPRALIDMEAGTFAFRMNIVVGKETKVNIPVDVVIQPRVLRPHRFPILIEAKSAGDFTNTNKRRKEEATKVRQLHDAYGTDAQLVLFLCGYFGSDYLGYEAAEGLDWVWEHRINDLLQLGI